MPEALKDAEQAIAIDPKFVKAYIRKALTQQAMKEHSAALETLQKATDADVEKKVSRLGRTGRHATLTYAAYARAGEHDAEYYDGDAAATSGRDGRGDVPASHERSGSAADHE
jgi:stress-induced-phosphoprotein 1